ncbi:MAG: hypothetical protein ACTHNG_12200 [Ginsengibacter sp.]
MSIFSYRKSILLFALLLIGFFAKAQQDHFVYLQTDNGKPFYVKFNNKIVSSSSEGYIILPQVTSGVYHLKVGFPKKEYPEETFSISVGDDNEGYLVKHFDDKGLQLFNLETLALVSGEKDSNSQTLASSSSDNNPFTKMLANVVKDSTILQNHEVVVDNPQKALDSAVAQNPVDSQKAPEQATAMAQNNETPSTINANPDTAANTTTTSTTEKQQNTPSQEVSSSPISKVKSTKEDQGLQMVYTDNSGDKADTVNVFMPGQDNTTTGKPTKNDNFDFSNSSTDTSQLTITPTIIKPDDQPTKPADQQTGFVMRKDKIASATDSAGMAKPGQEQVFYIGPKEKEKKSGNSDSNSSTEKKGLFSGLTHSKPKDDSAGNSEVATDKEKAAVNKIEVLPNEAAPSGQNSNCKSFADNEDFLRLRKKMASEDNKEGMIKVANKYFRSRCFSTGQIKDLSYLFLTDEGKYMFFDAAYAHTSDSELFSTLESQLKDPYYKKRFEALIGK